jgi:hypothetical protein
VRRPPCAAVAFCDLPTLVEGVAREEEGTRPRRVNQLGRPRGSRSWPRTPLLGAVALRWLSAPRLKSCPQGQPTTHTLSLPGRHPSNAHAAADASPSGLALGGASASAIPAAASRSYPPGRSDTEASSARDAWRSSRASLAPAQRARSLPHERKRGLPGAHRPRRIADGVPAVFGYHEVFRVLVIAAAALQYAAIRVLRAARRAGGDWVRSSAC